MPKLAAILLHPTNQRTAASPACGQLTGASTTRAALRARPPDPGWLGSMLPRDRRAGVTKEGARANEHALSTRYLTFRFHRPTGRFRPFFERAGAARAPWSARPPRCAGAAREAGFTPRTVPPPAGIEAAASPGPPDPRSGPTHAPHIESPGPDTSQSARAGARPHGRSTRAGARRRHGPGPAVRADNNPAIRKSRP